MKKQEIPLQLKIQVPKPEGLNKKQLKKQLQELQFEYDSLFDKFYTKIEIIFTYSKDNYCHFEKLEIDENIFAFLINVKDITRQQAEQRCWEVMKNYEKYDDCLIIWLPSVIEEDKIVKLTNTTKNIELCHD